MVLGSLPWRPSCEKRTLEFRRCALLAKTQLLKLLKLAGSLQSCGQATWEVLVGPLGVSKHLHAWQQVIKAPDDGPKLLLEVYWVVLYCQALGLHL